MREPNWGDFSNPKDYFSARCTWLEALQDKTWRGEKAADARVEELEEARKKDRERDLRNLKRFRKLQTRVRQLEGWQEEAFRDVIHAKARVKELEGKLDAATRISKSMAKVLDDEHSARLEVTSVLRGRNKALEAQVREFEAREEDLRFGSRCRELYDEHEVIKASLEKLQAVADEAVVPTGVFPNDYHCLICGWMGVGPAMIHKKNCPVADLREKP